MIWFFSPFKLFRTNNISFSSSLLFLHPLFSLWVGGTFWVRLSLCPLPLSSFTPVGLYSSLLSSRTLPPQSWGWFLLSLDQTILPGSSLAFRAKWTADMTCTKPTRWRSTPWKPMRWVPMDKWDESARYNSESSLSLFIRPVWNRFHRQLNPVSCYLAEQKWHSQCRTRQYEFRLNKNTPQLHIQLQRAGLHSLHN